MVCIALNLVASGGIDILIVGDVKMGSALDARGDGAEFWGRVKKSGSVDVMLSYTYLE